MLTPGHNNPWARFEINHISPSFCNDYIASPGVCFLKYVGKIRDGGNPKMWRGTAVEAGCKALWYGEGMSAALAAAYQTFNEIVQKNRSPQFQEADDVTSQRALIAPMLEQAALWKTPGRPNATQVRVHKWLWDDVAVPMLGFIDFAFDDLDLDTKSTEKIVNTLSLGDHARQVSFYRTARQRRGALLYVTDKKSNFLEVNDQLMNECMADLHEAALACQRFLAKCESPEDVILSTHIDWSSWKAPSTQMSKSQILARMRGEVDNGMASTW